MANYTTSTSDKKKKTALIWWLVGAVGVLGIENFYVGRLKNGALRVLVGLCALMSFYAMDGFEGRIPLTIVMWAIIALPNLFKLLLGVFRDNVGAALRE